MKRKIYLLGLISLLLLASCGGSSNSTSLIVNSMSLNNIDKVSNGDKYSVQIELDSKISNSVEVYLSLVPKDKVDKFRNLDNNTTAITDELILNSDYYLGAQTIELKDGIQNYEINVSVPVDMKEGHYNIIALLSDEHSTYPINFVKGDIFISENDYIVDDSHKYPSLIIDSFVLDDDVLLLSEDKNGTFESTISIYSKYFPSENIIISSCLEIGDECINLEILSKDGIYKSTYNADKIEDYTKNIDLSLKIPDDKLNYVIESIDNDIYGDATVLIKAESNSNSISKRDSVFVSAKGSTKITLYSTNLMVQASSPFGKTFSKNWKLNKMKRDFGALLKLNNEAGIDLERAYAYSHGNLKLRVLGKDINFFYIGVDANVKYDSFADTGINTTVKFCGLTLKEIKDLYNDIKTSPEMVQDIVDGVKSIPKSWNVTLKELKNIKFVVPDINATQEIKKRIKSVNLKKINIKLRNAKALTKPYSITKSKGYTQQFMVAIVPIKVEVGAGGEFGYTPSLGFTGITRLDSGININASIGGYARGGVGITGYSAGIEADFNFIEDSIGANASTIVSFSGDEDSLYINGDLNFEAYNTIKGPSGSLSLYAEYTKPKICVQRIRYCVSWNWRLHCTEHHTKYQNYPCGFKTYHPTKSLFDWTSYKHTYKFYKKKFNLAHVRVY